ncbi:MAG TPA: hypothetical protein VGA48_08365 [Thermoplasmata archaeon]
MPRVVIVGDRNSGKTTFLGLLYTAQVKFGSEKADDFRFHASFESLDEISGVFQRLMSGGFPDSATKEGVREVTFRLSPPKPKLGILSRRRRNSVSDDSDLFRLILLKSFEDDVARSLEPGSSVGHMTLNEALVSDAIVIMVDATELAVSDEDAGHAPMAKVDAAVEALLTAIQRSRAHGEATLLHPIFAFSKFDRVDPDSLRLLNLDAAPPDIRRRGPHAAYGKALVDRNLPKTIAAIEARKDRGLRFGAPAYFFSWVRTDNTASARGEKIRLRHSGAVGWEPDFSSEEYLAFLTCLGDIAADARR